jgi:hypothetical protein
MGLRERMESNDLVPTDDDTPVSWDVAIKKMKEQAGEDAANDDEDTQEEEPTTD